MGNTDKVFKHFESFMKKKINSRQKGSAGEREFMKEFKLISDVKLKRNFDQAAYGGHDIVVAERDSDLAIFIADRYAIEVKRRQRIKPNDMQRFWDQTVTQAKRVEKYPLLAYREDYKMWRMLYPLMWYNDKTIDGTADMSLLGAVKWIRFEMMQIQSD